MECAVHAAKIEGLTPHSIHLGPKKWAALLWWVQTQPGFEKPYAPLKMTMGGAYHYCGLPVRPGVVHGIVVDCS